MIKHEEKASVEARSMIEGREQEFIFSLKTAFLKEGNEWKNYFSLLDSVTISVPTNFLLTNPLIASLCSGVMMIHHHH